MIARFPPLFLAAVSIALWGSLATLSQRLNHVPPLLLVGLTLGIGSLPSLPAFKGWFRDWRILAFGTTGIFGYHLLLFLSFRHAPAVEANLINYLWPILIVLMSPVFLRGYRLTTRHLAGGLTAFTGAALVLTGGTLAFRAEFFGGYLLALAAACVWATYSVLTKRIGGFPTSTVGGFCFVSAVLALTGHALTEGAATLAPSDWLLITALGIGPTGIAFYTWDASLKAGDPRMIGALSYLTPLLSTTLLALFGTTGTLTWTTPTALTLIVGGAAISWQRPPAGNKLSA